VEIRAAYRREIKKWHPDLNPDKIAEATRRSAELNLAWEILRNAYSRKLHDESMCAPKRTATWEQASGSWTQASSSRSAIRVPPMVSVVSRCVSQLGHDGADRLFVRFRSGGLYVYFGVPTWVFDELMAAESKGRYLIHNIVRGPFQYERLRQ